jgi:hypothetical protein
MTTGRRSKPVTSYHLYDFERLTGHADFRSGRSAKDRGLVRAFR